MTRRTLLKLLGLFPILGPSLANALVKSDFKPALSSGPYLPASFPKWDRAIDGLEEAGKWAIEMERARLPADLVVPRVGQVWETIRDCEIPFRPRFASGQPSNAQPGSLQLAATHLKFLMGGGAQVRQGERFRVTGLDNPDRPLRVIFRPLRYDELHAGIVPEELRSSSGYIGYQLSAKTARTLPELGKHSFETYFSEAFRLVDDPG